MHHIARTMHLAQPPDRVWTIVGDFAGIHRWSPGTPEPLVRPAERGGVTTVERVFGVGTPDELVEQLVSRDDDARTLSYSMPTPPFAITDHLATVRVDADDEGSLVTWSVRFEGTDEVAAQLETTLGDGVFQPGLDAIGPALGA